MPKSAPINQCADCGGTMTRVERPPLVMAWRWFNYGYRPWGQVDTECAACGTGVAATSYQPGERSVRGRISHLRSHRTLEPVPRFYATVAATGFGVGTVASRILGRPRALWQVPLGAVTAAWLVMESSGLWNRTPDDEHQQQ